MTKKIKISELPEFDAAEFLKSDEDIAAYLSVVIEENDAALLAAALGDIARARGMTEIAKASGIAESRHCAGGRACRNFGGLNNDQENQNL